MVIGRPACMGNAGGMALGYKGCGLGGNRDARAAAAVDDVAR